MVLKVLGCGDAFGSGGNGYSCYHVKSDSANFLVDCGATALVNMKKFNVTSDEIDVIFISHFHGDHFSGLPFFILEAAILKSRRKKLTIVSPHGCEKKLNDLVSILYPGSEKILKTFPIEYINFKMEKKQNIGPFEVETFKGIHTTVTLPHMIRIKVDNKTIAYTGDTGWNSKISELATNADLLICECSFYNLEFKTHLNYLQIKQKQNELKAKRILLSHLGDQIYQNLENIDLLLARDGLTIEV